MATIAVIFAKESMNSVFVLAFQNIKEILSQQSIELIIVQSDNSSDKDCKARVSSLISVIDGVLFPGNYRAILPEFYGETKCDEDRKYAHPMHFKFAKELIKQAYKFKLPILGICAGSWYMNVARGGTLMQKMPASSVCHSKDPRDGKVNLKINIVPGTLLHRIMESEEAMTNSWHEQAVRKLGINITANATSNDGIVKAISDETHPFFLGVQFHPEYLQGKSKSKSAGYLSPEEIRQQLNIFYQFGRAVLHQHSKTKSSKQSRYVSQRALAFYGSLTEKTLNQYKQEGSHPRLLG